MDHQSLNQLITDETARAVEILIPNGAGPVSETRLRHVLAGFAMRCPFYTSDAADEADSVNLGGCRTIKKKIT